VLPEIWRCCKARGGRISLWIFDRRAAPKIGNPEGCFLAAKTKAMTITVSIVEDDLHTRNGLRQFISRHADFNCLSHHPTAEEAIEKLPRLKPDVVLMDVNLPGMSGTEAVRRLEVLLPQTQFIMSTGYKDDDAIFSALIAGANGYLLRKTAPRKMLPALTERELEVLELLALGCLYKEIADKLQISYRTVSTHIEHIYEKLHVHSRTQAVAKHLRQM
jgi:DNA-binding NarL/FixJ family response regulator